MTKTGAIGKVDPVTLKVTKYIPPTRERPRRIQVDSDGMVWFAEYTDGRIGRFDPDKETFKEFPLPHSKSAPYALGIAPDHKLWYSAEHIDVLGRLDPKTGEVTEYPYPHSEISMREFFVDSQGRMWYASSVNNKVGYFYINDDADEPAGK